MLLVELAWHKVPALWSGLSEREEKKTLFAVALHHD